MKIYHVFPVFVLLLTLASCDQGPSTRAKELRAEIDQVNENYFESQQTAKRLQSQLDAARLEKSKLEEDVKKAQEAKEASKQELERVKQEFDVYKSKYKVSIRSKVPGLLMPDFVLGGKSYQQVIVTQLDQESLAIQHTGGLGKLKLADLPEVSRDYLGLTAVHQVLNPTEDARPVSAKRLLQNKINEIDGEKVGLDVKLRSNSLARAKAVRELGKANEKLSYAKGSGGSTTLLQKDVLDMELQLRKLDAERAELEVKKHALAEQRHVIR